MKFCEKHFKLIQDLEDKLQNEIIQEYIATAIVPLELQDKVERRKNQCPVCFYRAAGVKMLRKIIKVYDGKKKVMA